MVEKCKEKVSEILTMLELSNEYPEDFKYVQKLMDMEKGLEPSDGRFSMDDRKMDYLKGLLEAKGIYLENNGWERLLDDDPL